MGHLPPCAPFIVRQSVHSSTCRTHCDGSTGRRTAVRIVYVAQPDVFDDGPATPVRIWSRIVRRPILAFGNSNGDIPMLQSAGGKDRSALRLLLLHDDGLREFDYVAGAEKALELAKTDRWTVVSMKTKGVGPSAFVFGSPDGEYQDSFKTAWESLVLRANGHDITRAKRGARVDREKLRQIDLHWHDLRHEGACRLLADGVDIRTIQLMLGHADIKQTQRYLNITDEELRKAMTGVWERRRQLKAVGQ